MVGTTTNRNKFQKLIKVIVGIGIAWVLLLVGRLYFLQVLNGSNLRAQAADQYVSASRNFYDRGSIFFVDKNGQKIGAATIRSGYILALNPKEIKNPEKIYSVVEPFLTIDRSTFMMHATKKNDPYERIASHLPNATAKKIREAKLKGVLLVPERWRYYPGGKLASQTIGFVAYDGNKKDGRYGLERYYQDVLARGKNNRYINFFAELFTNVRETINTSPQKREGSIVTTIDPSVQLYLESELTKIQNKWKSKYTMGIIIDPQTGEIRAMAGIPSFDANNFGKSKEGAYVNPLVERVYEMGSIMKPLTIAAGLDSEVITPQTTYDDTGTVVINGSKISNYDKRARGIIPIQQILSQSLNVGAAHVESLMGNTTFRKYMEKYGLREETGIDMPNEIRNLTKNLDSPRDVEYATASFGQGVAVTPVSMVQALLVLTDGYLKQPHVVSSIDFLDGSTQKFDYKDSRVKILKPKTVEEVTKMLVTVVDTALHGGKVKLQNFSIAAKTGTAQIASPNGGYYKNKYLHSFFGYFPAYNARYLILLVTIDPIGADYSSQTLTTPFMNITKFLINYYSIPPDR